MLVAPYGPGTGSCLSSDECACQCGIPCLLRPSHPTALLGSFCGSSASHGLIFLRAFTFVCTCALTLIHIQIYSELRSKCRLESQRWKPHGKTKGTSALKRAGVSLCWQGVSSLHNDALIRTAFCLLGDRCALQLLVEVKC